MKELKIDNIYNMDCLEGLRLIPDKSADLVLTDPPYNISKAEWDKWDSHEAYVEFMGKVFTECDRVLKDNGSLYFFHNDFVQMSKLQNWIENNTNFVFKNMIIWDKGNVRSFSWKKPSKRSKLRSWFSTCEYILYYTKQDKYGNNKEKLGHEDSRKYFNKIFQFIGKSQKEINKEIGSHAAYNCFYVRPREVKGKIVYGTSNFSLPTEETYNKLIKCFNIDKMDGFIDYKEVANKYNAQRYTHNLDINHNNIWRSNNYKSGWVDGIQGLHPTQKPLDILERIIKTSSYERQVILDPFLGSGSTAVACINTDRHYIGFELDEEYYNISKNRISEAKL